MQLKIKAIFPSVQEPLTSCIFWQTQHVLHGIWTHTTNRAIMLLKLLSFSLLLFLSFSFSYCYIVIIRDNGLLQSPVVHSIFWRKERAGVLKWIISLHRWEPLFYACDPNWRSKREYMQYFFKDPASLHKHHFLLLARQHTSS